MRPFCSEKGSMSGVDPEKEPPFGPYELSEDLKMWRIARDYYTQMGWLALVETADQKIKQIKEQQAAEGQAGHS